MTDPEQAGTPGTESGDQYAIPARALDEFAKKYGLLQLENYQLQVQVLQGQQREIALADAALKQDAEQRTLRKSLQDQVEALSGEAETLRARLRELEPPPEDTGPTVVREGVRRSRHGQVKDDFVPDGLQHVFDLSQAPERGSERVWWNGQRMREGDGNDFVLVGTTLILCAPPRVGDAVWVEYDPRPDEVPA